VTTEDILDDLVAITYGTGYTTIEEFQFHEEDYQDFTTFPLIIVESGPENSQPFANKRTETTFHPSVHFLIEDASVDTIEGWRDSIRNAIYNSTTLRGHANSVAIDEIEVLEPENRKLAHMKFNLSINFDIAHT